MGKLLNLLTIAAILYFAYWMIKRRIRHRKMEQQGYKIEEEGIRPITVFSFVMVGMYALYMLYFFIADDPSY
ncbi:MAG TPA: hypothetical protein DD716_06030 [Thiomicrospira sp.]|jgi:Na+/H+ antiporter NhaD/arsenite permease-like protein|nr:hypothetical protein [Thiomicrospira sp.]